MPLFGSPGGAAPRALVVEDNAVNQILMTRLLESRGIAVVVAKNGREAVDRLEAETFDVVLMDLQMPEMSGIEATAMIRGRERATGSARVPIIVVTANHGVAERHACLEAGVDGFVGKPTVPAVLFEAVSDAIGAAPSGEKARVVSRASPPQPDEPSPTC